MYTTVRVYRGASTLADKLIERQAEIRSLIESVSGFTDYQLVKTSDGAVSVTTCQDRAGCEESTRRARAWLAEKLPDLRATPEVFEGESVVSFSRVGARSAQVL